MMRIMARNKPPRPSDSGKTGFHMLTLEMSIHDKGGMVTFLLWTPRRYDGQAL